MKNLKNIEFYRFENEIYYCDSDGVHQKLTEENRTIVSELYDLIESTYPKANKALTKEYSHLKRNQEKFQHIIVSRFVRCNFGAIDHIKDINQSGQLNTEHVECPLRGICHFENIVCNPKIDVGLGRCTYEVLELFFSGCSTTAIAQQLKKAEKTVKNQIENGYRKLGVSNKADFVNFAHRNKLFRNTNE